MKKILSFIPVIILFISITALSGCNEATIPVDAEFLNGDWLDENGYVLNINDNTAAIYIDTGKYDVTYENGAAVLNDTIDTITIKGKDNDTIIIEGTNIEKCYAYRETSEKGKTICKDVREKINGCWKNNILNNIFLIIDSEKLSAITPGSEMVTNNDTQGIRLYSLSELEEEDFIHITQFPAVRIEEDCIVLQSFHGVMRYKPSTIEKANDQLDLKKIIAGEWATLDEPFKIWNFGAGGILNVDEKQHLYTARASHLGDTLTVGATDKYELQRVSDTKITITKDGITQELYKEGTEELTLQRKYHKIMQDCPDLFSRYPDNAGWIASGAHFGDIPYLADADYIEKSLKEGTFYVSSPEELASVTYYINAHLTDKQSENAKINIEITKDLNLSKHKWSAIGWIGTNQKPHCFSGSINGNNHTIAGIVIEDSKNDTLISSGISILVKNLTINLDTDYSNEIFSLADCDGSSVFDNCHLNVTDHVNYKGDYSIAGVNCKITNCTLDVKYGENPNLYYLIWDENGEEKRQIRNPVQLTIDKKYTVTRPDNLDFSSLTWVIVRNGEITLERNAENELSYRYKNTARGYYEIYLKAFIDGEYMPVSNTVSYEIINGTSVGDIGSLWN